MDVLLYFSVNKKCLGVFLLYSHPIPQNTIQYKKDVFNQSILKKFHVGSEIHNEKYSVLHWVKNSIKDTLYMQYKKYDTWHIQIHLLYLFHRCCKQSNTVVRV